MRRPALTKREGGCPAALPTVEEREAVARVAAMVGAVMEEEMEVAVREGVRGEGVRCGALVQGHVPPLKCLGTGH